MPNYQINLPVIEIDDLSNERIQNFLIKLIVENSFKFIIINGIISGTFNFSSRINHLFSNVKLLITYHGSFTQHTSSPDGILESNAIKYLINGIIWKVGNIKA